MRWVRYLLPLLLVNGQAGLAQTAPSVAALPAASLLNASPQEAAQHVGLGDRRFVAKTIYMTFPGSNILGTVTFFAQPEPVLPGICQVDAFDVAFTPHKGASPADGNGQYDVAKITERRLFTLAKDLPSPANEATPNTADIEPCHKVAIETDMFSQNGASNVFSADSPEVALRGSRLFAAVISAAAAKSKSLGFSLACDGSPAQSYCVKPRDEIGAMDAHHLETVSTDGCAASGEVCYRVTGGGYRDSWKMDIVVQGGDPNRQTEDIKSVHFGITANPLI